LVAGVQHETYLIALLLYYICFNPIWEFRTSRALSRLNNTVRQVVCVRKQSPISFGLLNNIDIEASWLIKFSNPVLLFISKLLVF